MGECGVEASGLKVNNRAALDLKQDHPTWDVANSAIRLESVVINKLIAEERR